MARLGGSLDRYPARVSVVSYLILAILGALALRTPWCSANAVEPITTLDAAFTATSAICVTGLGVRSTANDFSPIGQAVILILFQTGGVGIMTITTFVMFQFNKAAGLRERALVKETVGSEHSDLRWILRQILILTFVIESIGATLLWFRFREYHSGIECIWQSIFHAVSAFCNAGFALHDESLSIYRSDPWIQIIICGLIIIGGIGFPVLLDIRRCSFRGWPWVIDDLTLHTKLTLLATAALLVLGAFTFAIMEWDGALQELSTSERIMAATFHSVSCRTAGFNTIDLTRLSSAAVFVSILLMIIGAGACSTGGGVKVSTFALLMYHALSKFLGRRRVTLFRRTIPNSAIDRAMASAMLFLVIGGVAFTALLMIEHNTTELAQGELFTQAMFEVSSALGTVGLSLGLTADLSVPGKVVIIILMFLGRLGPISVFASLMVTESEPKVEYAHEAPLSG